jgi:hypothetical protein
MHRPTVASVARLLLAACVCTTGLRGIFEPAASARADDSKPASAANATDQNVSPAVADSDHPPNQTHSSEGVSDLVTKLGDDLYAVREQASIELVQKGIAAKPQLLAAVESSDAEVRSRAKRILSEVVQADFQRRLGAFSADVDGKLGLSLPGWSAFRQAVGGDRTARDLFVEMQQAEAPLLEAYELGPKQASDKLRTELAAEPAVIDRAAAVAAMKARRQLVPQSNPSSLGAILARLFVAGDNAVPITDDITARIIVLPQIPVFQQAALLTLKQADSRGEVCRKILGRWVARDVNSVFAGYNLSFAYSFNLKEGLAPAVALLKTAQTTGDPTSRYRAMLLVGKFGGKQHIALLEPFFKDALVCYDSGGVNQPVQTQIRDIALLMCVKLAAQDPKQFGFDRWQSDDQSPLNLHTIGFHNQEDRAAAFKKWEDWQAGQKSAGNEDAEPKVSDEKSG